jgi:predicted nuclease with TOPRIM domain
MTSKAKADIEESKEAIESFSKDLAQIEDEMEERIDEVEERWAKAATEIEEQVFTPFKKDVLIDWFGVAWLPFWQFEIEGERFELSGFGVN